MMGVGKHMFALCEQLRAGKEQLDNIIAAATGRKLL